MAALIAFSRQKRRCLNSNLSEDWRLEDRENPFEWDDDTFIKHFRLSRKHVKNLCIELSPFMSSSAGYPIEMQVSEIL